jgi:hypothetical protein
MSNIDYKAVVKAKFPNYMYWWSSRSVNKHLIITWTGTYFEIVAESNISEIEAWQSAYENLKSKQHE